MADEAQRDGTDGRQGEPRVERDGAAIRASAEQVVEGRKDDDHGHRARLRADGEQRQDKHQHARPGIPAARSRPDEQREQQEVGGEQILLAHDPRHRLHHDRMHAKEQSRPGGWPWPGPEPAGQDHRKRDAEQVKRQRDQVKALGPQPEGSALASIGQDGDRHRIRKLARRDQTRDAIGQRIDGQRVADQVSRVIPVGEPIAERREVSDRGHHQGEPKRQYGPAPHSLEATGSAAVLPAKTRSHRRTRGRRVAAHRSAATGW